MLLAKEETDDERLQALEALIAFRDAGLLDALPKYSARHQPSWAPVCWPP